MSSSLSNPEPLLLTVRMEIADGKRDDFVGAMKKVQEYMTSKYAGLICYHTDYQDNVCTLTEVHASNEVFVAHMVDEQGGPMIGAAVACVQGMETRVWGKASEETKKTLEVMAPLYLTSANHSIIVNPRHVEYDGPIEAPIMLKVRMSVADKMGALEECLAGQESLCKLHPPVESGLLTYHWFYDAKAKALELIEIYASPAAVKAHARNAQAEPLMEKLIANTQDMQVRVWGIKDKEKDAELAAIFEAEGAILCYSGANSVLVNPKHKDAHITLQ